MLIRTLGAALILCGSTLIGMMAVKRMRDRTKALARLVSALDTIESEVRFGLTPLPEVLQKLFGGTWEITPDVSLCEYWLSEIKTFPLKADEYSALEELGGHLGHFGQESAIERARERLLSAYDTAREEQTRKGKLFGVMGVAFGALIVIVCI